MRYAMAVMFVAGLGWHGQGAAQDFVDVVVPYQFGLTEHELINEDVKCPPGYVPLYLLTPNQRPDQVLITQVRIDRDGDPIDYDEGNEGGGFHVTVEKLDTSLTYRGAVILHCVKVSAYPLLTVRTQVTAAPGQTVAVFGSCPPPQVAVGFGTNVDGVNLQERYRVYLFGTPPNLVPLNASQDGSLPVPTDTVLGVLNDTTGPLTVQVATLCTTLPPGAQTLVVSSPVVDGQPHAVFGGIPNGWISVGNSFTVSNSAENNVTLWDQGGLVSSSLRYQFPDRVVGTPGEDRIRTTTVLDRVRGVYLEGEGVAPPPSGAKQQVVGRAVIGSLVVPSTMPVPPPTVVTIVEFYHAGLDHYFITANPKEISDLDSGVHSGWQRTGESFSAYGVGSSGRTGRRPVCRVYGNPAAGLDSHFYSASPQECVATLENFGDDWLYEAAEVFEMELPDTTTGACAFDRTPIYRLWNGRADSSHRFVKTLALRAQMIARGFISEGYGPNGVVFCALT